MKHGTRFLQKGLVLLLLGSGGILWAQSADQLYAGGRRAFNDGLWSAAISQFSRLIREYPEDIRADSASYLTAIAYFNSSDFNQSIEILTAFPKWYPRSAWNKRVAYWEGLSRFNLKQWRAAESAFERQIRVTEESAYRERSMLYLGACREYMENSEGAEKIYRELSESSTDYETAAQALFRLGQIRLALGRPSEALESFRVLVSDYSGSASSRDAGYWLGESLRRLGREEEALNAFRDFLQLVYESEYRPAALLEAAHLASLRGADEEALAYLDLRDEEWSQAGQAGDDPNRNAVMRIRAASALKTGRLEEARRAYADILAHPADESEAQSAAFNLAQTWVGGADAVKAIPYLEQASEGPDSEIAADAAFGAGQLLMGKNSRRGAAVFEKYAARFPNHPRREEALRAVVKARRDSGDNRAAIDALNMLVNSYPESEQLPSYIFLRGELALAEKNETAALKDFSRICKDFPSSEWGSEAFSRTGFIYAGRGEHVRAAGYYEKAAELAGRAGRASQNVEEMKRKALYSAGVAYLNGRQLEKAMEKFQLLTETGPEKPWGVEAAYYLGEACYDAGQYEKARRSYLLAARYGDRNWAYEAVYATGWTWFRQSNWKQAFESFKKSAETAPDAEKKGRSTYRAGLSLASEGQWQKALEYYERALSVRKSSWREEALYQKAWALLNTGQTESAFSTSRILAREFPSSSLPADLPFRMGENAFEQEDYAGAVKWFDVCSEKYPRSDTGIQASLRAAQALELSGNFENSARRYARWIASHHKRPGAGAAARAWGTVLRAAGNPQLADDARKQVLALRPENTAVTVPVILAWARVRNVPETAEPLLEKYGTDQTLPPADRAEALLLGAHLYRNKGRYSRARQIYEVLVRDVGGRIGAEAQEGLARSYADEGKDEAAAEAYLELPYLFPGEGDIVLRALRAAETIYREAGKTEKADAVLRKLKASSPRK